MVVKIFSVGKGLSSSPFVFEEGQAILLKHGIEISNEEESNLIVAASFERILPLMLKHGKKKKYLIWTNEPRYNTFLRSEIKFPALPAINIINIYTGLFEDNYSWLHTFDNYLISELSCLHPDEVIYHQKIAAMMTYRNNKLRWSLNCQGKELDLCYLRTQIALAGYEAGLVDIFGKGWPKTMRTGESRDGEWRAIKFSTLRNYNFNIALENTNWPYYCTEKIWDSIASYCLPIYYGRGNKIYEDFPKGSFIDYSDFEQPKDLFKYIRSMSVKEFTDRLNLCIETFNHAIKRAKSTTSDIFNTFKTAELISGIFK